MFKKLLIVAIVMLTTRFTLADDKVITNYPPKFAAQSTEQVTGEQVLHLPQDENKLYLTLYGDPADERYQELRKWFNENEELRAIRAQTHFAAIDINSKLFKERYADEIDVTPCLRVVTPRGLEVFRIDGNKIPMSGLSLNKGMKTELIKKLFDGRKQQQQKKQSPQDRMRDRMRDQIDERIDEKIDNANLPPVTSYVMSKIVKRVVHAGIFIVIVAAIAIGVFSALKKVRDAENA